MVMSTTSAWLASAVRMTSSPVAASATTAIPAAASVRAMTLRARALASAMTRRTGPRPGMRELSAASGWISARDVIAIRRWDFLQALHSDDSDIGSDGLSGLRPRLTYTRRGSNQDPYP